MYLPALLNGTANTHFFKKAIHTNVNCPLHMHYCLEVVYVTDGTLIMQVGNETRTISKGSATLIWPFEKHSFETPRESKCLVLEFSPELVDEFYNYIKGKQMTNSVFTLSDNRIFDFCISLKNGVVTDVISAKAALYPLCHCIYSNCHFSKSRKIPDSTFIAATTHIADHFKDEDLSLVSTATAIGVHSAYLSRVFGENAGVGFSKYLAILRCITAANLLIKTADKNISEIAFECGFSSIRSFNRQFYEIFETTPTDYRIKYKKTEGSN